jgi:membrane protease YdiL (CAAX protease family)
VIWFARTRSLWPPFMTHAFYNGTLVTLAYLGSSAG